MSLRTGDPLIAKARAVAELQEIERQIYEAKTSLLVGGGTLISEGESDDEREARLYHEMLQRLTPTTQDASPFTKVSELLRQWIDRENPRADPRHEAELAVARFLSVIGDMEIGEITEQTLRRFREKLAETPHQRSGQALNRRAIETSLKALRGLLRWEREGGHTNGKGSKQETGG